MGLLLEILITGVIAFVLVQMLIPEVDSIVPGVGVKQGEVICSSSSTISRGGRSGRLVTGYVIDIDNREGWASRGFEQVWVTQHMSGGQSGWSGKESTSSVNMAKESKRAMEQLGRQAIPGKKGNSGSCLEDGILNPYVIEKIIQGSDKTYRFTEEKHIERQGVKVELISITPRKDDHFLKFKIKNSSKDYFIPQGWACRYGEAWVEVEKFFPKYLVEAGEEVAGYLRVKASYYDSARRGEWVFQLQESGGAYRKFSIFY